MDGKHIGVGGAPAAHVLDNNIGNIPFAVHFNAGEGTAHVSAETLTKMTGNKVPGQINPVGISFGSTNNTTNTTHFITAHLGNAEENQPLNTLGREFHISSHDEESGESEVNASHSVALPGMWPRATPVTHHLQDLSGMYGDDHHSYGHSTEISADMAKMQIKQAVNWRKSVGASLADVMHGCVTAKDGDITRVSIPLDASMDDGKRGQLSSLCQRKENNLRELMGDHHITEPLLNPTTGKFVKHVIVSASAANEAAKGLVRNLHPGPLGKGITFTCRDADGGPPTSEVTMQGELIRVPGCPMGTPNVAGKAPLVHTDVSSVVENGGQAVSSPSAGGASTDTLIAAMFKDNVRLRDSKQSSRSNAPAPTAVAVEVHGAPEV